MFGLLIPVFIWLLVPSIWTVCIVGETLVVDEGEDGGISKRDGKMMMPWTAMKAYFKLLHCQFFSTFIMLNCIT